MRSIYDLMILEYFLNSSFFFKAKRSWYFKDDFKSKPYAEDQSSTWESKFVVYKHTFIIFTSSILLTKNLFHKYTYLSLSMKRVKREYLNDWFLKWQSTKHLSVTKNFRRPISLVLSNTINNDLCYFEFPTGAWFQEVIPFERKIIFIWCVSEQRSTVPSYWGR